MRHELNIKQRRVMTYFITATKELILKDGIENLTVRKVAAAAGYNSATMYNYFEDMEELVVFASMGHLRRYSADLEANVESCTTALETYRTIYKVFSKHCFSEPEVFYNLFYGKHKKRLKKIISTYYDLFPEELGKHKGNVLEMLTRGDIMERDSAIMPSLIEQGFVKQQNAKQTVTMVVRMFQSYLYDAWMQLDDHTIEERTAMVMESFDYIMAKANM